jgi:DNA-binding winged helix-turn-helix (wHTH) protein
VNEALRIPAGGLLTTSDLAARSDFTLGLAVVSPSTRTIAGPGGTADVEPRVMQVLVVLADAAGQVITRETLFERCWGGIYVGDDSLNRAVGAVRKLATGLAGSSFEIETIPRTGYRLTGAVPQPVRDDMLSAARRGLSRRTLIAGGAGVAMLAGGGVLWSLRSRESSDARFEQLIEVGESAIRTEDANREIIRSLEQATAIRPDSARAWGLLAFFRIIVAQLSEPKDAAPLIDGAQDAARRAFSLDPREPNALLAMFELQGSTLDWFTRDRRLRRIIAIDPTRIWAITELVLMLQAAGMNRESWYWNERALSLVPLSLDYLTKRAFKLWIAGRVTDADKVIDQVRALYPTNEWAWWARFVIFATSGRAHAAQAMLNSNPKMLSDPAEAAMWRVALPALIDRSAVPESRIREVCFHQAKVAGQTHGPAVMILSALGDVDGGFAIADGALLGRGPIVRIEQPGSNAAVQEAVDRTNMQWLFTPPCAAMRADPRFGPLCDGIGLTEYWRRRGVQPDYMKTER